MYNMTNSLMNTFSSFTLCSLNNSKGFPFNSIKYFLSSINMMMLKKGGPVRNLKFKLFIMI